MVEILFVLREQSCGSSRFGLARARTPVYGQKRTGNEGFLPVDLSAKQGVAFCGAISARKPARIPSRLKREWSFPSSGEFKIIPKKQRTRKCAVVKAIE